MIGSQGKKPSQGNTLAYKTFKDASTSPKTFWSETDNINWHRQIQNQRNHPVRMQGTV